MLLVKEQLSKNCSLVSDKQKLFNKGKEYVHVHWDVQKFIVMDFLNNEEYSP